jgi:hypothetical protein
MNEWFTVETRIRDGLDYLAEYTYRFKCGVWVDQKNLNAVIRKPLKGGTKPWMKRGKPILLR